MAKLIKRRKREDNTRWWTVEVETTDSRVSFEDERFDRLTDLLIPHSVALGGNERGWSARLAVEADSIDQAVARTVRIVEAAGRAAGLPEFVVVKAEAQRWLEFERELGPLR